MVPHSRPAVLGRPWPRPAPTRRLAMSTRFPSAAWPCRTLNRREAPAMRLKLFPVCGQDELSLSPSSGQACMVRACICRRTTLQHVGPRHGSCILFLIKKIDPSKPQKPTVYCSSGFCRAGQIGASVSMATSGGQAPRVRRRAWCLRDQGVLAAESMLIKQVVSLVRTGYRKRAPKALPG